ncbi:MAG: peptidylprolyl isomerase [Anaerolineales bacterium]|jgi:FKBP-type peptidyl-prolyl cis-trans isomerase SlyD
MTKEDKPVKVADDLVVTIDYTLTVDDEVLDSSEEEGPLGYLQGHDNIISGLESELSGMKIGEKKTVTVSPVDGYGEVEEEAIVDVPLSEFPEELPLQAGLELEVTDKDENIMLATILEVGDDTVTLDTNHPLAGKTLNFEVSIVDLRYPTEEELAHGHVHSQEYPQEE